MMMHFLAALLLALPVAWPMYQFAPNHEAVFDDTASPVAWQRPLPGKVNGGLAIVGGVVYVESFDHRLYALDARTGAVRWSADLGNIAMTAPIVADGLVIAGTGSNEPLIETPAQTIWGRKKGDAVVALSAKTGAVVWQLRTVGEDMPTPALVHVRGVDAIVFANGDNHLRALRLRDGKPLWAIPTQGISTMSSAAAVGNTIYAISGVPVPGVHHDELYAVNADTGAYLWRSPVGNADCSPTVADGMVFVEGSGNDPRRPEYSADFNDIVAVDATTGKLRWSWRSGWGYLTPTASHEQAIAGLEV
ncbi:MAG TPA: PQQ-binding-like beta-propeller repeat protein, partial [Candidatus Baltobacteraceae bacterium]|nr:PQQ-binding-like beta-propeller repeat protein [Candidatus Baltobacteraceae bacterium]